MDKLFSGRFILTVVAAIVFMVMAIAGTLTQEAVTTILATVFALYFTRNDRNNLKGE